MGGLHAAMVAALTAFPLGTASLVGPPSAVPVFTSVGMRGGERRSVGTDGESDSVEAAGQGCALLQPGGPAEEPLFRCGCGHGEGE